MRTAASSTKSRSARLRRWLLLRAITLRLMLPFALAALVSLPVQADAEAAGPSPVVRHLPTQPGLAHASAASLITGSGYFGGLTSQGWPVAIKLSRDGKRVKQAVAGMELKCTSGESFSLADRWRDLPVRARRFRYSSTGADAEGGMVFQATSTINGKLNRRRTRISGAWQNTIVMRNAAGATVDTCDTGVLRYTVQR